jgi:hypothetical protein
MKKKIIFKIKNYKKNEIPNNETELISNNETEIIPNNEIRNNIKLLIHQPDTNINNHFIGIIFIHSINFNHLYKIKWDKNKLQVNATSIFLNKNNEYPIFSIEDSLLNENFKYKKYIKEVIKEKYSIKNKYTITVKYINTYNYLHNYVVVLKSKKYLDKAINIQNTSDDLFHWRTYIDTYNNDIMLYQSEIYKIIKNKKYSIKPEKSIFDYILDYNQLTNILTNVDFGY